MILHTCTWDTTAKCQSTDGVLGVSLVPIRFPGPTGRVDLRKCFHMLADALYRMHTEKYVEVMLRLHPNVAPQQPSQLINVTVRRELLNIAPIRIAI